MNKLKTILVSAALGLGVCTSAFAGHHHMRDYGGPQGFYNTPMTVADVKSNAYDDQIVTLRGRLVNYLGHDKYEFADQTGSIEVELDDDYNWSFISKGEYIEIVGEVDRDFLSISIDVRNARSLERGPGVAPANMAPQAPVSPIPSAAPAAPAAPTAPAAPAPAQPQVLPAAPVAPSAQ